MSSTGLASEPQELEAVWYERSKTLLGEESREKTQELVEQLRHLAEKEGNLQLPPDDGFYLKFLRGGKMSPPGALDILKKYFELRQANPNYFQSCLSLEDLFKTTFSAQIHAMLPHRDRHGRRIYVFRPGRWDPDKISFADLFCAGYILCEMVAREERTQIAGLISITDAKGFGWKQVRAISMSDGKNLAAFFNISFPIWLRQSHVLNAPRVFNMLFSMLGPFLSEAAKEEVVFHSGDLASMRDYFNPETLPSDLGGSLPPVDNAPNVAELRQMKEFFRTLHQLGFQKT